MVPFVVWASASVDEGSYPAKVDLVHEHVRWFDATASARVDVVPMLAPAQPGGEVSAEWRRHGLERLRASLDEARAALAAARAFRQSRGYRAAEALLAPLERLREATSRSKR